MAWSGRRGIRWLACMAVGVVLAVAVRPLPTSLARDGRVPRGMSAASSRGHAWVAFTEAGTNSGSNARNPASRTISGGCRRSHAYVYDDHRWTVL